MSDTLLRDAFCPTEVDRRRGAYDTVLGIETLRRAVTSETPSRVAREDFRRSAVLVPFICRDGRWHLLFTRRTDELEHHRGQVSFPGGASDGGETPVETALREVHEEIGIPSSDISVLGEIDEIWTPSRYVISPVVGIIRSLEKLAPNPAEVSRVFTAPLAFLADEGNAEIRTVSVNEFTRDVYYYHYDNETIWGATAFIFRGLVRRIRAVLAESSARG